MEFPEERNRNAKNEGVGSAIVSIYNTECRDCYTHMTLSTAVHKKFWTLKEHLAVGVLVSYRCNFDIIDTNLEGQAELWDHC